MSFGDRIIYTYIKNIKRWMECPVCHEKMLFIKKENSWKCTDCGYQISESEFLDDFVFWFCDECNAYLNNQEGFDKNARKHICRNCGYENDTTFDNIKGMCIDCGSTISNPEAFLCENCKELRKKKAKEWMKKMGKGALVAAVVAGSAYSLYKDSNSDDENADNGLLSNMPLNDDEYDFVTESWMNSASEDELRSICDEMENKLDELDYDSEEHTKLFFKHTDVVNAISSRFPLNLPHREHGWYLPNDDE